MVAYRFSAGPGAVPGLNGTQAAHTQGGQILTPAQRLENVQQFAQKLGEFTRNPLSYLGKSVATGAKEAVQGIGQSVKTFGQGFKAGLGGAGKAAGAAGNAMGAAGKAAGMAGAGGAAGAIW